MDKLDAVFVALCATAAFKYAVLVWGHRRRPVTAKHVGKVTAIWYYPVKSCRGIQLQQATCTEAGIKPVDNKITDRQMMVVREDGSYRTLRQIPKMASVSVAVDEDAVTLQAPGMPAVTASFKPAVRKVLPSCRLSRESLQGLDLGDEVAKWLTTYLGEPLRLVYSADELERRPPTKSSYHTLPNYYKVEESRKKIPYFDFGSYHLCTEESLDDLNSHLADKVPIRQFRPSIVVAGSKPYAEDSWEEIFIGQVRFSNYIECPRCILITVDPDKGVKHPNSEPLETLKKYRMLPVTKGVGPAFGRYIFPDLLGNISVGDDVYATLSENPF